jgi:hypothetical protein
MDDRRKGGPMSSLFNGTWQIDLDQSLVWDEASKKHVRDEVGQEIITLKITGDVQDYEVLYGDRPQIRMGYTARYDDTEWVSYAVREIISDAADIEQEISEFKQRIKATQGTGERSFQVGQSYGLIRLVSVDAHTHYRVARNPKDNLAQSIMLRRMASDEQSYLATVLDIHGVIFRIRRFVRVAGTAR